MRKQRKIGWQKYEDVIEDQVSNPFIEHIISKMMPPEPEIPEEFREMLDSEDVDAIMGQPGVPISEELIKELSLAINYDCWVGHTNFDITPSLRNKIEKIEGIEALKVVSRYRFFIGVGKMFNFSDVRKSLENEIEVKDEERTVEREDQGSH